MTRDELGRIVRDAWIAWAHEQPSPKPSWLVPYDELDEADREADRRIGEAVAAHTTVIEAAELIAADALEEQVHELTAVLADERARSAALVDTIKAVVDAADACPYCLEILDGEEEHTDDCPWPAMEDALAAGLAARQEGG